MSNKNNKFNKNNQLITLSIILTALLILSPYSSAIVGKIGNGRMILNNEVGEKIDRSILVINDNNVSVGISLFASGNLSDKIKITDKDFILKPGEQKKAGFTILLEEVGKYESKISVKFTPIEANETGIVLSAIIINNVYEKGTLNKNQNSLITKLKQSVTSSVFILIFSTSLTIIAILVLLYIIRKKNKKRDENGGGLKNLKHSGTKT